jgi:hypothetical protein
MFSTARDVTLRSSEPILDLAGKEIYKLKGERIYKLTGELVGRLNVAGSNMRLDKSGDRLFPAPARAGVEGQETVAMDGSQSATWQSQLPESSLRRFWSRS